MHEFSKLTFFGTLFFCSFLFAENKIEDIDAILIRDDSSIGVHAPPNYFLDKDSASNFGVCSFYIQEGNTFNNSPAVIYAQIAHPFAKGEDGVEKLVKEVADPYKAKSPKFKLEKQPAYTSKNKYKFEVRYFLNGPSPNNFEAAAYLKNKKNILQVIYSARKESDFTSNIQAFYNTLDRVSPYSTQMPAFSGSCLYPVQTGKTPNK
ncbi:MAG: hypothetical protein JSU04_03785 [Bdellovibrionales bacterium]|nr:hypothetical protein [Bdellovibrionales bacterium]